MPDLRVDPGTRFEVDVLVQTPLEHVRYGRRVSSVSDAVGVHGLPVLRVVVAALGLVSQHLKQAAGRRRNGGLHAHSRRELRRLPMQRLI